jgi:hypothetical protein
MTRKDPEAVEDPKYSKEQFLASAKYAKYGDVLNALLNDSSIYTSEQVDKQLDTFFNKEAK